MNLTVYISVTSDSRGTFLFDSIKKRPEFYRKYEAYVVGSERNISVQFHFEGSFCSAIIVEVSKRLPFIILYIVPYCLSEFCTLLHFMLSKELK